MIGLIDSHAHLESPRFEADRTEVIARAARAGVTRILTCGSDLETSAQDVALAQQYPGLYVAVGIHGHRASTVGAWHAMPPGVWLFKKRKRAVLGNLEVKCG